MAKTVTCVDVYGKQHTVPVSDLQWRPAAYAIVVRDDNVLLSPQFDGYDLPGGGLDLGEGPEEAVIRETKEETGLDVRNPRLLTVHSSFFKFTLSGVNKPVHSVMLYYRCDLAGGELSADGFDDYEKQYARLAEWFPISKLDSIKVKSSFDWRDFVKQAAGA